jgi:hypothetical protein
MLDIHDGMHSKLILKLVLVTHYLLRMTHLLLHKNVKAPPWEPLIGGLNELQDVPEGH